jgi:hypothetical protein
MRAENVRSLGDRRVTDAPRLKKAKARSRRSVPAWARSCPTSPRRRQVRLAQADRLRPRSPPRPSPEAPSRQAPVDPRPRRPIAGRARRPDRRARRRAGLLARTGPASHRPVDEPERARHRRARRRGRRGPGALNDARPDPGRHAGVGDVPPDPRVPRVASPVARPRAPVDAMKQLPRTRDDGCVPRSWASPRRALSATIECDDGTGDHLMVLPGSTISSPLTGRRARSARRVHQGHRGSAARARHARPARLHARHLPRAHRPRGAELTSLAGPKGIGGVPIGALPEGTCAERS